MINYSEKISSCSVHFINKCHSWYTIFVSLSPYSLRLWFYSSNCAKDSDSAIKNSKRSLNLDCKIHVARCIDNVYSMLVILSCASTPKTGCSSRCDCYTSLLLLLHPIHCCCSVMNFTYFMRHTCVVKNSLGGGSFPSINMCHDSNVSVVSQICRSSHELPPIMCECFVCLSHFVSILTFFYS